MVQYRRRKQDWSPRGSGDPIWPKFVDSYLETAIWASVDENGRSLDRDYDARDFAEEDVRRAVEESNDFILANREDLELVGDESMHGHDFWLTRNGHGAGFFDRGYGEAGDHLTASARAFREVMVYVGDDGALHFE